MVSRGWPIFAAADRERALPNAHRLRGSALDLCTTCNHQRRRWLGPVEEEDQARIQARPLV